MQGGAEVYGDGVRTQTVFVGLADLVGGEGDAFDDAEFVEVAVMINSGTSISTGANFHSTVPVWHWLYGA